MGLGCYGCSLVTNQNKVDQETNYKESGSENHKLQLCSNHHPSQRHFQPTWYGVFSSFPLSNLNVWNLSNMSGRKHHLNESILEHCSKRAKTQSMVFYDVCLNSKIMGAIYLPEWIQALCEAIEGNPTKSRLERSRLSNLLSMCGDFGLWDGASEGKRLTKRECIEKIVSYSEGLEIFPPVSHSMQCEMQKR